MNSINNFYILSLWNLFETEIVANGAALPFQNLLSINKLRENGEVFLNFSTFCWSLDFLSTVSLIKCSLFLVGKNTFSAQILRFWHFTLCPSFMITLYFLFSMYGNSLFTESVLKHLTCDVASYLFFKYFYPKAFYCISFI